jgi:hypothetical protein
MNQPDRDLLPLPDFVFKLNENVLKQLVACLRLLLRGILLLILVGLFTELFPFRPWQPLWYLKFGQAGFQYGPTCILAFLIAILAELFEPDPNRARQRRMRLVTVTNVAIVVFSLLIPLQVVSYGQIWIDSEDQVKTSIATLHSNLAKLRDGLRAAGSVEELNAAMSEIKATPAAVLSGIPLPEQKRRLLESLDLQETGLSKKFSEERQQKLVTLFFSTLKGVGGSAILALTLLGCKRWIAP